MRQTIRPGGSIDALTPDELFRLIPRPERVTRVRAPETVTLDSSGNGLVVVYKVPIGAEFAIRRVVVSLGTADPTTGAVLLNVAGKCLVYRRSGNPIEFGQPQYGSSVQVPGVQTWGDQQGPYIRNGETFEVLAVGLTPNIQLTASVEGLLVENKDSNTYHG